MIQDLYCHLLRRPVHCSQTRHGRTISPSAPLKHYIGLKIALFWHCTAPEIALLLGTLCLLTTIGHWLTDTIICFFFIVFLVCFFLPQPDYGLSRLAVVGRKVIATWLPFRWKCVSRNRKLRGSSPAGVPRLTSSPSLCLNKLLTATDKCHKIFFSGRRNVKWSRSHSPSLLLFRRSVWNQKLNSFSAL